MFEKEAREYIKANNLEWELECDRISPVSAVLYACLEMAEFGYNKAKEEMQEQGLALQSDMDKTIKQNIALKKELEKANEWHYMKDGDLPKNNKEVLVILKNKRMKISIFMENKFTIWNKGYNTYTKLYDVIAWKEIVLPELPKENEDEKI